MFRSVTSCSLASAAGQASLPPAGRSPEPSSPSSPHRPRSRAALPDPIGSAFGIRMVRSSSAPAISSHKPVGTPLRCRQRSASPDLRARHHQTLPRVAAPGTPPGEGAAPCRRRQALAQLLDPHRGADLNEAQAQSQVQALGPALAELLKSFNTAELMGLWSMAFPSVVTSPGPDAGLGAGAHTPYGLRLQSLYFDLLAQTLFKNRGDLLSREAWRAQEYARPFLAGAGADRLSLTRLGLLLRSILRLVPARELRRWLSRLQALPFKETVANQTHRAQAIFILRVAAQGLASARQGLIAPEAFRSITGKPQAAWEVQAQIVTFALQGISPAEHEALRRLCTRVPLPFAQEGSPSLDEALELRLLVLRALHALRPSSPPTQSHQTVDELMDRGAASKEPMRSRLLLQGIEIISRMPAEDVSDSVDVPSERSRAGGALES